MQLVENQRGEGTCRHTIPRSRKHHRQAHPTGAHAQHPCTTPHIATCRRTHQEAWHGTVSLLACGHSSPDTLPHASCSNQSAQGTVHGTLHDKRDAGSCSRPAPSNEMTNLQGTTASKKARRFQKPSDPLWRVLDGTVGHQECHAFARINVKLGDSLEQQLLGGCVGYGPPTRG